MLTTGPKALTNQCDLSCSRLNFNVAARQSYIMKCGCSFHKTSHFNLHLILAAGLTSLESIGVYVESSVLFVWHLVVYSSYSLLPLDKSSSLGMVVT